MGVALAEGRGLPRGNPPPRSLAASRCVCKAWRDMVDGRRLLLSELFPQPVRGIFLTSDQFACPSFLSLTPPWSRTCSATSCSVCIASVKLWYVFYVQCNGGLAVMR
jgi:hypothetical protein